MQRVGGALVLTASLLLLPGRGWAQTSAPPDEAAAAECFHPHPLPRCGSFWITRFGTLFGSSGAPSGTYDRRRWFVTGEVAKLTNRGSGMARGFGVFTQLNDNAFRAGLRMRYRWWSVRGHTFDVSPGLILLDAPNDLEVGIRPGANLLLETTAQDIVGAMVQLEVTTRGPGIQGGVYLGSAPGAILGALFPLWILAPAVMSIGGM